MSARATRRYMTALASGAEMRTAKFRGRDHLVVPVVAMVGDSVVRPLGSEVGEFVPKELLAEAPAQWDGRPVVPEHPNGGTSSANLPHILESMAFGTLFNSRFSNGSLVVDAWIDVEAAEQVGGDAALVVERLEAGEEVEVSVGAWVWLLEEEGESPSGVPFGARWASLGSDHLALLPDGVRGACSNDMGCGAPRSAAGKETRVKKKTMRAAVKSRARRPTFSGTESTTWSAPSFADYVSAFHEGDDPPSSVADSSAALKRRIASTTLLGDASATDLRDLAFFPVVRPSTGNLNERALRAVLGGRGAQADISDEARESARSMARRLLNSEFDAEIEAEESASAEGMSDENRREIIRDALVDVEPDVEWLWVEAVFEDTVVYSLTTEDSPSQLFERSYTITDATATVGDDRREVRRRVVYDEVSDGVSALTKFLRAAGVPGPREPLSLEIARPKASCGCGGDHGEGGDPSRNDAADEAEGGDVMSQKVKDLVGRLVASERSPFGEEDRDTLAMFSEERLETLAEGYESEADDDSGEEESEGGTAEDEGVEASEDEEKDERDPDVVQLSREELDELKAAAAAHRAAEKSRKDALVERCAKKTDAYTRKQLEAKTVEDLTALAKALGADAPETDYSGRGVPVDDSDDSIPAPPDAATYSRALRDGKSRSEALKAAREATN